MAEKYAKQQQPCGKFRLEDMRQDVSALMGLVSGDLGIRHFNLESGILVASKVGNLHS